MTRVKSIKPVKKATTSTFKEDLSLIAERATNEIKKVAERAGVEVDVIIQVIPTTKEGVSHGGQ